MSLASLPTTSAPLERQNAVAARAVRVWLWVVALFVLAMVVVGGATRLTESGLSITEWNPVLGVVPPLSEAAWLVEFEKYRQIPEYQQINRGMSLADFKTIYWWEWVHRLLGRIVGLVFAVPFAVFALRGWISRRMMLPLGLLFVLGGLQGAVGWWMVASGLTERTDVSQYRLAVHLTLACIILAATVWIAEGFRPIRVRFAESARLRTAAMVVVGLILVQIFLGGLVAGLNAGLIYNTWPLMDGEVVPAGLLSQSPWWINFFENHLTVQFVHRVGAYLLLAAAVYNLITVYQHALEPGSIRRSVLLLVVVLMQLALGVVTLLLVAPLSLALAHQTLAAVLLIFAVVHARRLTAGSGAR